MSTIRCIGQKDLAALGPAAVVIDVREPGEFAGERLAGSVNVPLSRLESGAEALRREQPVVIVCRSGQRAREAARRLERLGFRDLRVLDGGLAGCCDGLERGPRSVWAMERQVRLAAGALVLAGAALAWLVHPAFLLLCAGVGAGLMHSAVTDTCAMARVLALLPWNR